MLPTTHSEIIDNFRKNINKLDPNSLLPISEKFRQKQEKIHEYYTKIALHKIIPNEKECQEIVELTPFMTKKHYEFFKENKAVRGEKPDFDFASDIISMPTLKPHMTSISQKTKSQMFRRRLYGRITQTSVALAIIGPIVDQVFYMKNTLYHEVLATYAVMVLCNCAISFLWVISEDNSFIGCFKFSDKNMTKITEKLKKYDIS